MKNILDTPSLPNAIDFDHVSKRYRLGGSPKELLLEITGIARLMGRQRSREDFLALDDVTFSVPRGSRIGLIGRNGAGKTTLLKLIAGNYRPTTGSVKVAGTVQALMTMGQGFHPDYTGRDNIQASLQYNGLSDADLRVAFDDVVDFCELGPFLEQPFKTYSSGMQSRLMFATATAIKPEVLIIDEVLGAGDAYFLAKSKRRVENIVASGCTLLLVSHSMAQVLELCEEAIWLDGGRVRASGEAFPIVKAYEEEMYGALPGTGNPLAARRSVAAPVAVAHRRNAAGNKDDLPTGEATDSKGDQPAGEVADGASDAPPSPSAAAPAERELLLQLPVFRPHAEDVDIPPVPDEDARQFRNIAPGGLSRWGGHGGLKVVGLSISGPKGPTGKLVSLQPARFSLFLEAEMDGDFRCTYGIALHDLQGRAFVRLFSQPDRFTANAGEGRRVEAVLNPLQIGPGVYTVGVSVLEETTIEDANSASRFDLLSRSFLLEVEFPDSLNAMSADFVHSGEWSFDASVLPQPETATAVREPSEPALT